MSDNQSSMPYTAIAGGGGLISELRLRFGVHGLQICGDGIGDRFLALDDATDRFEEFAANTVFEDLDDEEALNAAHACALEVFGPLYVMAAAHDPEAAAPGAGL